MDCSFFRCIVLVLSWLFESTPCMKWWHSSIKCEIEIFTNNVMWIHLHIFFVSPTHCSESLQQNPFEIHRMLTCKHFQKHYYYHVMLWCQLKRDESYIKFNFSFHGYLIKFIWNVHILFSIAIRNENIFFQILSLDSVDTTHSVYYKPYHYQQPPQILNISIIKYIWRRVNYFLLTANWRREPLRGYNVKSE